MDGAREVAWAVTRAGCRPAQLTGDFEALVREVEATWTGLFPRRLGYLTRTTMIVDAQLVRLEVRRGDFEGQVELVCELQSEWDRRATGRIRAVASARSQRVTAAERAGQRVV